jgi:hypothetical protein
MALLHVLQHNQRQTSLQIVAKAAPSVSMIMSRLLSTALTLLVATIAACFGLTAEAANHATTNDEPQYYHHKKVCISSRLLVGSMQQVLCQLQLYSMSADAHCRLCRCTGHA